MPHQTIDMGVKHHQAKLRIVLGGDDAGFDYKAALIADLSKDHRVLSVEDVGPFSPSDKTAYPHYAVAAARKVRQLLFLALCTICYRCWSRAGPCVA